MDTASQSTARTRCHKAQQGNGVTVYSKETVSQSTAWTQRHRAQQGQGVTKHSKETVSQSTARKRCHRAQHGHGVTEHSKDKMSQSTARKRCHKAQQGNGVTEHSKDNGVTPLRSYNQSCRNFILWAAPVSRNFCADCKSKFVGRPAANWAFDAALLYLSRNCRCI
jgi:hypothetical protein